jgi:hypothetical protein
MGKTWQFRRFSCSDSQSSILEKHDGFEAIKSQSDPFSNVRLRSCLWIDMIADVADVGVMVECCCSPLLPQGSTIGTSFVAD